MGNYQTTFSRRALTDSNLHKQKEGFRPKGLMQPRGIEK